MAALPSSSRTKTTKKAKATMAPTTLALVRSRNWRRARVSDALEWLAYARLSERRKARLSPAAAEDLDGVLLMVEGALPDAREREWADPLVEGAFMVRVVCAVLLVVLLEVLGALPLPMPMFESPANDVGAAEAVVLLANALDSRRVMPMPPVLLGEVAYRLLPLAAPPMPAPLTPTALDL